MANPDDPLGPYERWMFGPGKTFDLPGLRLDASPSLSCLAEFSAPVPHPVPAVNRLLDADGIAMRPRLPTLWDGGPTQFVPLLLCPETPVAMAQHDPGRLASILDHLQGGGARHLRLNFPVRAETIDPTFPLAQPAMGLASGVDPARPLVVMAVIDHGIAFAHQALGGRLDYCWSQSAPADGSGAVLFGREFTREGIAALRAVHGDEDAIYRATGLLGGPNLPPMPLARAHSHGAHVLGTAAGDDPNLRVVAVDLPSTALWDTSGFGTDMFLLAGLHYIFDRADRIAAAHGRVALPVVVNISIGWSGGPHDGSSAIEAALEELIRLRRTRAATALVLPSGNMFQDRLSAVIEDRHFETAPDGKAQASLRWFAPPHDMTSTFAEMWLAPGKDPSGTVFSLTTPFGEETAIGPQAGHLDVVSKGKVVGQLSLDRYRGQRWRVTICLAPTEPKALPEGYGAAPAGEWRIAVRRNANLSGPVALRVQRDAPHEQGKTGGRQSFLLDPGYDPFDAQGALAQVDDPDPMVRRFDGLNGLATLAVSLNVGGHVASLGTAARYSSAGTATRGVDASAPTDRSPARSGIVSAGTRTGSFVALQGTSSAAPQVALALAQAFLTVPPPPGPVADNYLGCLAGRPGIVPVPPSGQDPGGQARLGQWRITGDNPG